MISKVFEGRQLLYGVPSNSSINARCFMRGRAYDGTHCKIGLDDNIFSKHMLFLGSIGMGKTTAINQLIYQLRQSVSKNDIVFIFDSKGDFYENFYKSGDIVISNDQRACGPLGNADYWNLFEDIYEGDQNESSINEIADMIFAQKINEANSQKFFPWAARDILSVILSGLFKNRDLSKPDNSKLYEKIINSTAIELRDLLRSQPEGMAISNYISDPNSGQTMGVMSTLIMTIREMLIGNFRKPGTLGIQKLVREKMGKFVFIEYDLSIGSVLTPIYSLLFDLAIKQALGHNRTDGNVWFFIDEFRLLPYLKHIDDAVNFGRSMGIKLIVGIQNIEQIYENYGEYRSRSILSGFSSTVAFRLLDVASSQYFQDLQGHNRKIEALDPTVAGHSISEQIRDGYVVECWDIQQLKIGESIISICGGEPFLFKFDYP